MNTWFTRIVVGVCLIVSICATFSYARTENRKSIIKTTQKTVNGEVGAISNNFIAVVYSKDAVKGTAEEIALPIAKEFTVQHKRTLSEIKTGDRVGVVYDETTEEYDAKKPDGSVERKIRVLERKARTVAYLHAAEKEVLKFNKPVQKDKEGYDWQWEDVKKSIVTW